MVCIDIQPYGSTQAPDRDDILNVGGFSASLVLVVMIGMVLDWRTPGGGAEYAPDAFVWAMSTQYLLWALGLTQLVRYRLRARRVIDRATLQAARTAG